MSNAKGLLTFEPAGGHRGIVLALCCLGATFAVASFRSRNVDSYE